MDLRPGSTGHAVRSDVLTGRTIPDVTSTAAETTGTVHVCGVDLGYSRAGGGPVVIIAHGLTSSRANNAVSGLLDLSPVIDAGYTLIAYDARGHGESSGTTNPDDYRWSSLADDLLVFAEAVAPGEQVAVVGNSMGTATAIFTALKEPERIGALVLTAPPTAWQTRAAQSDHNADQVKEYGAWSAPFLREVFGGQ